MNTSIWRWKRHFLSGVILGAMAIGVEIVLRVYSEYFMWHVTFPNIWGLLNMPAILVLIGSGLGNSVAFWLFVSSMQWFIIGYTCSLVISALTRKAAPK